MKTNGLNQFNPHKFFILQSILENKEVLAITASKNYKGAALFGIAIALSPELGGILFSVGIYHDVTVLPFLFSAMAGLFLGRRLGAVSVVIANLLISIITMGRYMVSLFEIFYYARFQVFILLILASLIPGTLAEKIGKKGVHWTSLYIILGFLPAYLFSFSYSDIFYGSPEAAIIVASLIGIIGAYIKTKKEESVHTKPEKTIEEPAPEPGMKEPEPAEEPAPVEEPAPEEEPDDSAEGPFKDIDIEQKMDEMFVSGAKKDAGSIRKCPHCGAALSELTFYKLKAGDSAKCEYCEGII